MQHVHPWPRTRAVWWAGPLAVLGFVALYTSTFAAPPGPGLPGNSTPVTTATRLGGTLADFQFFSQTLGRGMPYRVYLPPDYATSNQAYPVLYMLHGVGGNYTEWTTDHLPEAVDDLIQRGVIQPMLVVMPDASGRTYWANWPDNGLHWADYLAVDVVHEIDSHFRTLAGPANRAVGGLSMGGLGALHSALHHPDVFGVVGGHSPSVRPEPDTRVQPMLVGPSFDEFNPSWLLLHRWQPGQRLTMWIDVGLADPYRGYVEAFRQLAVDQGLQPAFHEFAGKHEGAYWSAHVGDYLAFYSQAFTPPPAPAPVSDPSSAVATAGGG